MAWDKEDITAALNVRPELSAGLEALVRHAQTLLGRFAAKHEKEQLMQPDLFLHRLTSSLKTIVH